VKNPPAGRAWALGEEMRSDTKRWITEDEDILRQAALAGTSVAEIASVVGRTESAIRARAYILRVLLRPRRYQATRFCLAISGA